MPLFNSPTKPFAAKSDTRENILGIIESNRLNEEAAKSAERQERKLREQEIINRFSTDSIPGMEKKAQLEATVQKRGAFSSNLRYMFLAEALVNIYENCAYENVKNKKDSNIVARSLISNFVNENGAFELLRAMKHASPTLSQLATCVESVSKFVLESSDPKDADTFVVNVDAKSKFFDDLDATDTAEIEDEINARVNAAISEFIDQNSENKLKIKEILHTTASRIQDAKDAGLSEDIQESYNIKSKQDINKVRSASTNLFTALVTAMSESCIKSDDLKSEFMTEGKLDMGKIVDRVTVMYTVMEMVNTMKIQTVNEAYIEDVLNSMIVK